MKKFLVTILAVFYLGVSSGATMYFHYCMGQLVEIGLVSAKAEKCSKCSMKTDAAKDCCKHETKQAKVDTAQKTSDQSFQFKSISTEVKFDYYTLPKVYISSINEDFPLLNSPPNLQSLPVFLRNCSFLI